MTLPLPQFFSAPSVGEIWHVRYLERAAQARAWSEEHAIHPAAHDHKRVALLLIDVQNTFCLPQFELFVGGRSGKGAIEDNVRLSAFIYENLDIITSILPTLDTHTAAQIFHPCFWIDRSGKHPPANTIITIDDLTAGDWKVDPALVPALGFASTAELERYARHYVSNLASQGKYPLIVWPYHAMLGSIGHALVAAIEEAVFFHGMARKNPARMIQKGDHPLTEYYSAIQPEINFDADGRPLGIFSAQLAEQLAGFDRIIIAGQAKSHCVAWTVMDLQHWMNKHAPAKIKNIYLLEDATSSVVVPGLLDFTEAADARFREFAAAGMKVVKTTEPVATWPGW